MNSTKIINICTVIQHDSKMLEDNFCMILIYEEVPRWVPVRYYVIFVTPLRFSLLCVTWLEFCDTFTIVTPLCNVRYLIFFYNIRQCHSVLKTSIY